MTGKNILLALLFSLILTFFTAAVYIFYPLVIVMMSNQQGSGIGAATGSWTGIFLIEFVLFVLIFIFLQWKSKKS